MQITKQDINTLQLLDKFNCSISVSPQFMSLNDFTKDTHSVPHGAYENMTDFCIETLNGITPPAGTPNSEMSDECKGLIQLLFEVEKAIV